MIKRVMYVCLSVMVLNACNNPATAPEPVAKVENGDITRAVSPLPSLPVLKMEKLAAPVATARCFSFGLAPNAAGNWRFVGEFMNYNNTNGPGKEKETIQLPSGQHYLAYTNKEARPEAEWVIADLQSGKTKLVKLPGFHSVISCLAGNGRIFFGVDYAHVYYYDPVEDTVKPMARVVEDIIQLRQFYKFMMGADGMLYGSAQATNGLTTLIRINPDTLEYKLYDQVGIPGRREGLTYGYYLAIDPPWIYVAVGQGNWELFAVNAETGEKKCLIDVQSEPSRISVQQDADYCTASLSGAGRNERYWLIDGTAIPIVEGKKPDAVPMSRKTYKMVEWKNTKPMNIGNPPEVDTAVATAVDSQGKGVIPWRPAAPVTTVDPKNPPPDRPWTGKVSYAIENAAPVKIESLITLSDGSLYGNTEQYNGHFRYDPSTKKLDYYGKFGPSQTRTVMVDGKIYIDGYPNTVLYVYDPAKPWTANTQSGGKFPEDNPKWLGTMGQGCAEAHHCRALLSGGNGRIYMMGQRERWSTGTGLGYYDIKTNKFFGLGNVNKEIDPVGLVVLPKCGRLVLSGKPAQGGDSRLIIYDLDLKEIGRIEVFPGLSDGGALFNSEFDTQFFGCVQNQETKKFTLYRYDLLSNKIMNQTEVPGMVETVFQRSSDHFWWAVADGTLFSLESATLKLNPIGKLDNGINFPVWIGRNLYGANGGCLVRIAVP